MNYFMTLLVTAAAMASTTIQANTLTPQDYMEIEQLYAQYAIAIDGGDAEAYAATFTPDGVFNNNVGREAIMNFAKLWHQKMNGGLRRHWNSNLRVTGDGKTATGSVYLIYI